MIRLHKLLDRPLGGPLSIPFLLGGISIGCYGLSRFVWIMGLPFAWANYWQVAKGLAYCGIIAALIGCMSGGELIMRRRIIFGGIALCINVMILVLYFNYIFPFGVSHSSVP